MNTSLAFSKLLARKAVDRKLQPLYYTFMKKTSYTKSPEFRIKFVTADGSLILNREGDINFWKPLGRFDKAFAEHAMTADARTKGVKVVSYEVNFDGVVAIVEWL